jgi:hypothetical protein
MNLTKLWEGYWDILLIVSVIFLLVISLYLMKTMVIYTNYHAEAVADCVAYNFNHTNSSCWV